MLFGGADTEPVNSAAQRIMDAVRGLAIAFPESAHGIVTVSAGLMHWQSGHDSVDDVIAEADSRLYVAKHHGRNRLTTDG